MGDGLRIGRESVLSESKGASRGGAPEFAPAPGKYSVEGPIGRGGMGEILLVTDRDLRRQVAMKVLLPEVADDEEVRLHFVAEAQATSQLEHPGIPPVHDIGATPDGRLYFTMKLVRGRTLREVLHDLFVKRPEVQREWTLHRLVTVLERLCETLHFAHERGVVHRDVKPENVMLGDYGEVHLMDWGLARVAGTSESSPDARALAEEAERVQTARTEAALETQHGAIKGTRPYMAPEQLDGTANARTDVYALGLLLYEVLTLHPAFDPHAPGLLQDVRAGAIPDVEARNPRRPVPPALAETCRHALARDPAARFPSARALGQVLRGWLDGTMERERRHQEAEAFAAKGVEAVGAYERAKAEVVAAEAQVERQAAACKPWQPLSEKRPLLQSRRQLEAATIGRAMAFTEALRWLEAATAQEERNPTARAGLARLWRGRLADAEGRREPADARYALTLLMRYDDGALAAFARGDGTLTLTSTPRGAEVFISRFVEEDGVLVAREERRLGPTPLQGVPLPMGSYLCVVRHPGFREAKYPVHITRQRAWEGTVRLLTEAQIGADFVLVPGGPFMYGEGSATQVVELADFLIARTPVTFSAWGEYMASVEREQGLEAARRLCPGTPGDGPFMERTTDGSWRVRPGFVTPAVEPVLVARHGPGFEARCPVVGVSFDDARAYCAWRTRTTGREHRLPTEAEREKAARGVDGRRFPWGDTVDSSLLKCRDAREESAQPEPVGSFPTATSVYGMVDAAGSSWDWTDSWIDARQQDRVLRGGGWLSAVAVARCANRHWSAPSDRLGVLGLRLVRPATPG